MSISQKVSIGVVFAAVVFLLVAAFGLLPGLVAFVAVFFRMFLFTAVLSLVRSAHRTGQSRNQPGRTDGDAPEAAKGSAPS
jgi:hypothetical protein